MGPNGHLTVNQHHPNNLSISLICSYTDPEAYYYTTGMLIGLHEMERFEEGTKRFWEEMKRFEDGTKRFRNGTLCTFGNGTLCTLWPVFNFPDIRISSHGESAVCLSSIRKIRISFISLDQFVYL